MDKLNTESFFFYSNPFCSWPLENFQIRVNKKSLWSCQSNVFVSDIWCTLNTDETFLTEYSIVNFSINLYESVFIIKKIIIGKFAF